MKTIIKTLLCMAALTAGLTSCEKRGFLDPPPFSAALDPEKVFSDALNTNKFLANCYNDLWGDLEEMQNTYNFAQISDEGDGVDFLASNNINNGVLSSDNILDNLYLNIYTKIRRTNVLIANQSYMNFTAKDQYVAEARFLRAFYYSELVKRYGGVALVTSPVAFEDINSVGQQEEYKKNLKRATFSATIDFIVKELDAAAAVLPWAPQSDLDRGHATAAACVALKARVLLLAASKLFNNPQPAPTGEPGSMTNELIGYTNYDINRWKLAADACREFFTKNATNGNWYSLYNDYYRLFTESRDPNNKELIFYRQGMKGRAQWFDPFGRLAGFGYLQITLNHVDKYEMTNGKMISETGSGYNDQQWWVNRDPRLAQTVIKNGDIWKGVTMEFWAGSATATQGRDYDARTRTGIFFRKFLRSDGNTGVQKWHYLRLADVYLMLAEAENEFNGPTSEVYSAVNIVRARPTVNMPGLPVGLNKNQMRDRIRNERAVELALESQRYFDVRRWMIAEETDNGPLYGFQITKEGSNVIHTRYIVENRKFLKRMYLYPFPIAELYKGASIEQNPGY